MESNNHLGIYIGRDHATVVSVQTKGRDYRVMGSFAVSVASEAEDRMLLLTKAIAEGCTEHKLKTADVAVALDCTLFMQHQVHSEFSQPKQVAATVRFDTEEVMATDVSTMAVAFQIEQAEANGAKLNVFTAEQAVVSEILLALQSHGFDPVYMVPDVCGLTRFVRQYAPRDDDATVDCLMGVLSRHHGYFVHTGTEKTHPIRAFTVGTRQGRTDLLAREILTTMASLAGQTVGQLSVFDTQGQADHAQLAERLALEVTEASWFQSSGAGPNALAQEGDPVAHAIAMGAALLRDDKGHVVNFRDDFMPFQGAKLRMQSALRWASVGVTILLLALGTYLQVRVYRVDQDRNSLIERLAEGYKVAMPGRKLKPKENPVGQLEREIRRINAGGGGPDEADSVPQRFVNVLVAFNALAKQTDLQIEKLVLGVKTITITGSTSNRNAYLKFTQGLREHGFEVGRQNPEIESGGRNTFQLFVTPLKK
ncbi:hypothetical protein ACFL3F_00470 [Planctomycetota bacterium]